MEYARLNLYCNFKINYFKRKNSAVISSKDASIYSIIIFISLFLINLFIIEPNAAHGVIAIGHIIRAIIAIIIVE